jgi:hypothetical protein
VESVKADYYPEIGMATGIQKPGPGEDPSMLGRFSSPIRAWLPGMARPGSHSALRFVGGSVLMLWSFFHLRKDFLASISQSSWG